jgi:hypothetical protein
MREGGVDGIARVHVLHKVLYLQAHENVFKKKERPGQVVNVQCYLIAVQVSHALLPLLPPFSNRGHRLKSLFIICHDLSRLGTV